MKTKDFYWLLNKNFPKRDAADWDEVGEQAFFQPVTVKTVLVCLDITKDVINFAISKDIDVILHHHPWGFGGWRKIRIDQAKQKESLELAKNKIGLFALHTNYDASSEGTNYYILEQMECPHITETKTSTFAHTGIFTPGYNLKTIIEKTQKLWPTLPIHYFGNLQTLIKKVVVCSGAGGDILLHLKREKNQVFITGEMKWNHWIFAQQHNMNVIVLTHYMEAIFVESLANWLQLKTPELNVIKYVSNNPIKVWNQN